MENESKKLRVLMVVTSHERLGETGESTGVWLEELATPYMRFADAGAEITIASPKGGAVPIDPKSEKDDNDSIRRFRADERARAQLAASKKISEAGDDYDGVFVAGGHGAAWDLPNDRALGRLLAENDRRPVALVCHGVAALATAESNGAPVVRGRRVTGFTDAEEVAAGYEKVVPFLIERRFREQGAEFQGAPNFKANVVRDRGLITGQNPASSPGTADALLEAMRGR
jgi:putative intracellular protease/amidase